MTKGYDRARALSFVENWEEEFLRRVAEVPPAIFWSRHARMISLCGPAAINEEGAARDIGRGVGREKECGPGDLVQLAPPAGGNLCDERLVRGRIV